MTYSLPPAIQDRLASELNVWLCTVRGDGSPHVTPVWFVYVDQVWWIGCDGPRFAAKYGGWDITQGPAPDNVRVLLEVPVRRWLLAGSAQ